MSALAISSKPVSISEFKIITDKYLTVKEISKEEIETLTSSQESLFEEEVCYFISNSLLNKSDLDELVKMKLKFIGTINKNTLSSIPELIHENKIKVIKIEDEKEDYSPWDLVQAILDKTKKMDEKSLLHFSKTDNDFRFFMNVLEKDIFRFLLLKVKDQKEVAEIFNEKVDFKYKIALKRISIIDDKTVIKLIDLLWRVDSINSKQFDEETSKRALISLSYI